MRYAWIEEPPFNFAGGQAPDGVDVALLRQAAASLGERIEFVRTEFAELLPGLAGGAWDVTAAMFVTPERRERAHFTRPVWHLGDGLLVRSALAGKVTGYRSIAVMGLPLAVLEGQVQMQTAVACGVGPAQLVILPDYASAAEAVRDGWVAAYASVQLAHLRVTEADPGLVAIAVPAEERQPSPGAYACATATLRDRLSSALAEVVGTPAHLALMRRYGLGPDEMP